MQPQIASMPADGGSDPPEEPREVSGLTTGLVLEFVERESGREAVDEVLRRCGLTSLEAELRDENGWFSDRTRVELFEAAGVVLGEPHVGLRIGAAAIDHNVGQALKVSLRALGSPRLVYSNVGRANGKFNRVHEMSVQECGSNFARIRNVPLGDASYHPCDCDYNIGLLSCVPMIFGEAPARIKHSRCIGRGDPECIYEAEWQAPRRLGSLIAVFGGLLAAIAAVVLFGLPVIDAAVVLVALVAIVVGSESAWNHRRRTALLTSQVREQADAASLLMTSMQDLVSGLQLDDVLSKVTANAGAAVGGAEFALLVEESQELRCRSSSMLPASTVDALEQWARSSAEALRDPLLIDDVTEVPELTDLAADRTLPLGSLCAAPVTYGDRSLGVLVALASSTDGFLPRDIDLLSTYGAQAAIALHNATQFETQQELANRDPLTGLFNHRNFHETLERELERCRRHGGGLGLVVFDLDGFKLVNDTEGHARGDEVLRRVAIALERSSRSSDLAFRVGGDEFALLLPNADVAAAEAAGERARTGIAAIDGRTSVSVGVGSWPGAGPTKDALLAAVDRHLYEMKRNRAGSDTLEAGVERSGHDLLASASRLATRLAPLDDEGEIAATAVTELIDSFGFDRVRVLRALDSEVVEVSVSPEPAAEAAEEMVLHPGSAAARALREGEPVIDNDFTSSARAEERHSQLGAPIRVDGEVWGALELEREGPYAYNFDDMLFADTIASGIGGALHRGQLFSELEGAFMRTLAVLCDALEAKDTYTAAHARDVSDLAERVGAQIGLAPEELRTLTYGALLHDIGKIAVRGELLNKPGPLTDAEYEEVKEHTVIGARMLERIPYFVEVRPLVLYSHERWDGCGYPEELSGEQIPLGARVIAACDAFHAMTSDRPYRRAMSGSNAIAELRRNAGSQFDPDVVDALIAALESDADSLQPT